MKLANLYFIRVTTKQKNRSSTIRFVQNHAIAATTSLYFRLGKQADCLNVEKERVLFLQHLSVTVGTSAIGACKPTLSKFYMKKT